MLDGDLAVTAAVGLVPLGGAYLAYRQATQASRAAAKVGEKAADRETYESARELWRLRDEQRDKDAQHMQRDMEPLRARLDEYEKRLYEREERERRLRARIFQLEGALMKAGIPVPPEEPA